MLVLSAGSGLRATVLRKVDIVLGALAGEAKCQVSVLDLSEWDQVRKDFGYLESLYGDRTTIPVLRSQFFSLFIWRLRELAGCRDTIQAVPPLILV